jgi:hypothetical protein
MFVMMTILAIPLGYLGWAMNWIRQRHEFLKRPGVSSTDWPKVSQARWPIRILGEETIAMIFLEDYSEEMFDEARRLFPESTIVGPSRTQPLPPDPTIDQSVPLMLRSRGYRKETQD